MRSRRKLSLTAKSLLIGFNIFILVLGYTTFALMSRRIQETFLESDRTSNHNKTELIAKSIRQSAITNDYVGLRRVFKDALTDSSIKMIRMIPVDGAEGICVDVDQSCYSNKNAKTNNNNVSYSKLYFDQAETQLIGTVSIAFESLDAAKLAQIISFYLGAALLVLIVGFNIILAFFFRVLRNQTQWSIDAVRSLARGEAAPEEKSILVLERDQFTNAMAQLENVMEEYKSRIEENLQQKTLVNIARQVAHDIRSPLAALDAALVAFQDLPEDKRIMVRSAVSGIRDIANSLLKKSSTIAVDADQRPSETSLVDGEDLTVQLLSTLIDTLISEKRLQYRSRLNLEISADLGRRSYGLFAKVHTIEFKRVLSNLINNSVEAIEATGRVTVSLDSEQNQVVLKVTDTGKGIPKEILPKLMVSGATFGKTEGSGLGLSHAKMTIESWGGSFGLSSQAGQGATVEIRLPKAGAPFWFVPQLNVADKGVVIVLDDDTSIHQIWKGRFDSVNASSHGVELLHFSNAVDIERWHQEWKDKSPEGPSPLYLFDFELLGQTRNGLDIIAALGIEQYAILVTSRYEERETRENCERLKVSLIPKGLAGFVPIKFYRNQEKYDAILIDNERIVHLAWKSTADDFGKKLKTFFSSDEFFKIAGVLDRETPIYIDSDLGDGIKGEGVAKEIYDFGFRKIYLATGFSQSKFKAMPWISAVVGKSPPW